MVLEQNTSDVRIVSYNILSQNLVSEEKLPCCDPEYIQEEFRRGVLQKVLEAEVKKKSIICLQEVNTEWAAWLYTWFNFRNYIFINTQYSKKETGYMGTSIAFSREKFLLDEVKFLHPFKDTSVQEPGLFTKLGSISSKLFVSMLVIAPIIGFAKKHLSNKRKPSTAFSEKSLPFYLCAALILTGQAVWQKAFPDKGVFHSPKLEEGISARHRDTIPMVKLRSSNSEAFWVATVHMPCKFWNKKLMTAFGCNIANTVQLQAGDYRYILAGDFNVEPPTDEEPCGLYDLYVDGEVCPDHPHFPVVSQGWEPKLQHPMVSAYKTANGKEPDTTNYVNSSFSGLYTGTLDYIWLSPGWKVFSVDPLMGLESIKEKWKSFPCEENMSDHLKIGADLRFLSSSTTSGDIIIGNR